MVGCAAADGIPLVHNLPEEKEFKMIRKLANALLLIPDVTTLEHVKFVMKGGEVVKNEY